MFRTLTALVAALAALVVTAVATAAPSPGAVYTLSNAASGNAVLVFDRAPDGTLARAGSVGTGGIGTGALLGSQGALVVSDDGRRVFAVNAGSNTVAELAVRPDGLRLVAVAPSGGTLPISVATHGNTLYVLNAGGAGGIAGFDVSGDTIAPIPGSTQPLGTRSFAPAQVQFSPDGGKIVVSEKGSRTLDVYPVTGGVAHAPVTSASAGAVPFGFDFDNRGHLLVSEAGSGSASSYAIAADGSLAAISAAVATHQGAPCWLVASKNGRYAYTANGGSGTITGFSVAQDGSLSLLDPSGVSADLGAGSHPLDEAISENGRYLYNLTDGRHEITAFRIGEDGSLVRVGAIGGLPAGADGIAAR